MAKNTTVFLKSISVQTIVTIVMGVLEIMVFAIMSRLLSKADFGYFAALTGIIIVFQSLSEAGLGSAIIQKKDASEHFISTAFTLSVSLGILGMVLVLCFASVLAHLVADDTLTFPLRCMSLTVLFHSLVSVGNAQIFRSLDFKRVGIIQCVAYVLSAGAGIYLAWRGFGLMSIVIYTILNSFLAVVIIFGTSVRLPRLGINRSDARSIVSFGGWLTLGVILNNITQQIDKLFMSKWLSVEALGSYNRPAGFANTISSKVNGIFDTVLFPMLSSIQENKEAVVGTFYRAVGLLNSFSVVLASAFFLNADLIIEVFFGIQWIELAPIMRIISISIIFNINGRLVDCFFRSLNYVKVGFFIRLIGVFFTFLCLYVGSRFGVKGVAIGLVFANVAIIIVKMLVLCFLIKASVWIMIKKWILAWKPVLLLALIGLIYSFIPNHQLWYNIVFAVFFGITVLLEFVFIPVLVSEEYKSTIYPTVRGQFSRLFHK